MFCRSFSGLSSAQRYDTTQTYFLLIKSNNLAESDEAIFVSIVIDNNTA